MHSGLGIERHRVPDWQELITFTVNSLLDSELDQKHHIAQLERLELQGLLSLSSVIESRRPGLDYAGILKPLVQPTRRTISCRTQTTLPLRELIHPTFSAR